MHIAIDARMYHIHGGHGRYLRELIKNLEQLDTQNQCTIILKPEGAALYSPQNPNFKILVTKTHWYTFGEQISFARLLYKLNADLVHFPHWNVPLLYRRQFIVTIHDLILRAYPHSAVSTRNPLIFWIKYAAFRTILRHALHHAQHIITVSNATREQISEYYPELLTQITVIPLASVIPDHHSVIPGERSETRDPATQPYFLYIGTAYPHKNLPFLLHAFHQFGIRYGRTHRLVLVGTQSVFYDRLLKTDTAQTLLENGDLIYKDDADDAALEQLYTNATAVICPALMEGFGLPALEAATRGVPVICSRIPSFEEVLGDTATYFNPHNLESLIAALLSLRGAEQGEATKQSNLMRPHLITRASQFSWQKTAAETLVIFQTAHD